MSRQKTSVLPQPFDKIAIKTAQKAAQGQIGKNFPADFRNTGIIFHGADNAARAVSARNRSALKNIQNISEIADADYFHHATKQLILF